MKRRGAVNIKRTGNRLVMSNMQHHLEYTSSCRKLLLISALIFSTGAFLCSYSRASLSIATINTIQGEAPQILDTTDAKVLQGIYFNLKLSDDKNLAITPNQNRILNIAYNSSPSDYSFGVNLPALSNDDILDNDGDYLANTNNIVIDNITSEWRDASDNVIDPNSKTWLGSNVCKAESYRGDTSVKVTLSYHINTEYGDPRSSEIREASTTFKLIADDGICYIRPGVLALNIKDGWPDGDNKNWAGSEWAARSDPYDTDQFKPRTGYYAWATDQNGQPFPTFGFPEGRFRIVPKNPISQYTYELVKNPNSSLVSTVRSINPDSKSEFKFNGNVPPKGEYFVILVTNINTKAKFIYRFSLNKWIYAIPVSESKGVFFNEAKQKCSANGDRFAIRAELTNSPYATKDVSFSDENNWYQATNSFKRAIGGGLMGEWGKVYFYAPRNNSDKFDMMKDVPDSELKSIYEYNFYFTSEISPNPNKYYSVGMVEGNVIMEPDEANVACVRY